MPVEPYTHDFIYKLGDGGQYIIGEVEFNHDKEVSYRINTWSEPIKHETMVAFTEFIDRLKMRYDQFGDIKHVEIIKKGYVEP